MAAAMAVQFQNLAACFFWDQLWQDWDSGESFRQEAKTCSHNIVNEKRSSAKCRRAFFLLWDPTGPLLSFLNLLDYFIKRHQPFLIARMRVGELCRGHP